ncbi:hypothetical protein HanXRQr2_Chr09g0365151 [Helianthus annuus]|uniref:Uncharacterized protein n=1 Tax=Helianthus annuus TaxID=4232 RepID=A0A9K3I229_HELAN|nr:hypothetical protein HanXRQr2_Chr09g0365151 [Helianthus annuus]KAJ0891279.1 hypothetical protein HanPSC8_Chr09g0351841 [Helianthus annuus]
MDRFSCLPDPITHLEWVTNPSRYPSFFPYKLKYYVFLSCNLSLLPLMVVSCFYYSVIVSVFIILKFGTKKKNFAVIRL